MDRFSGAGVTPRIDARCPSWKIQTIVPSTALSISRFRTSAFIGTTMLPVNRNSSTNVASAISRIATGSRSPTAALVSMSVAVGPPTSTWWSTIFARMAVYDLLCGVRLRGC